MTEDRRKEIETAVEDFFGNSEATDIIKGALWSEHDRLREEPMTE